jgi:dienelactone hydrolase
MSSVLRQQLFDLLGDIPVRPSTIKTTSQKTSETDHYIREDFLIDNGHHSQIPTVFLTPKNTESPYPTVIYLHVHGHRYDLGKNELFTERAGGHIPANVLTQMGFAVICIDAYAFGGRQQPDEMTQFKQFLWEGKTLWGMMLRDDLITLDYLHQRPDVDASRIATVGMSMGSTRAWWLAALDERIRVTVAIACLTRYQDLIAADGLPHHSIYFYVPGILNHMDAEDILSLIAPRPLLALTGDQDPTTPVSGVHTIEAHLRPIYSQAGKPKNFRNVIYPGIGHEFTTQMWDETTNWLRTHLL